MKLGIFFIYILIIILLLYLVNKKSKLTFVDRLPRKIWTFWNGKPPRLVDLCINTWYKHCPNWDIVILNESNLNKYIPKDKLPRYWNNYSGQYARLTDFMRLYLLKTYGGAWLDATIILNKNLDKIFPLDDTSYNFWGGFANHNMNPPKDFVVTPESWLLISKPNSTLINIWYDEFYNYLNNYPSTKDYINKYLNKQKDINWSGLHNIGNQYHTVYFSLRVGLFKNKIKKLNKEVYLTDLIKNKGLYLHYKSGRWSSDSLIHHLTQNNEIPMPDILKICNRERKKIEEILKNKKYIGNSILSAII